jgi:hypothetical protein
MNDKVAFKMVATCHDGHHASGWKSLKELHRRSAHVRRQDHENLEPQAQVDSVQGRTAWYHCIKSRSHKQIFLPGANRPLGVVNKIPGGLNG